jgi:ribonuclease HI
MPHRLCKNVCIFFVLFLFFTSTRYSSSSNTKDCKRENWLLQFDGGSRGNPGTAGAGAVLYTLHDDGDENNVIKKTEKWAGYFYIGNTTNNVAEYMGLIEGLKQAIVLDIKYIEFEGDSHLVSLAIL